MPEIIAGFPEHIREVPDDRVGWLRWRDQVLAYRELLHRLADSDHEKRAAIVHLAAQDPAFFMCIFGVVHDPKGTTDFRLTEAGEVEPMKRPRGWYPWIPYPFQVRTLRWIDEVLENEDDETGKSDGVVEKSRDVGATWMFCLRAAHHWLFGNDILVGFYSHKEALVDSGNPKSMFYKVRALLGLNRKVPATCHAPGTMFDGARVRLPDYLYPAGFEPKLHDLKLNLKHPTRTNQISGEATTSKAGIGDRTFYNVLDEGAKNQDLLNIWSGMGPVTDHRFTVSSADRREGDGMYILVEQGRAAQRDPSREGPSFLSLPWHVHPLRDDAWERRMRARYKSEGNEAGFAREYEIDWNAGMGDWVYPIAQQIVPEDAPWDPTLGQEYCTIDPGIRDPTAIEWFQYMPGTNGEYRLFEALVVMTPSAAYLAPILMGWPPGHEVRERYPDHSIQDVMDAMWEIRRSGREVKYVGDPYGDNVGGADSESFYEALWRTSRELNEQYPDLPPVTISVMTKYDEGARYHRGRKEALTRLIPRVHFHDTPRVRYIVDALQNYRYKSQDEGRIVQNEPSRPAHDWSSHPTTAAEFMAVVATVTDLLSGPMLKPVRQGPSRTHNPARYPTPGYATVR